MDWIIVMKRGSQEDGFKYADEAGNTCELKRKFPAGAVVLIADDFTNSGSTLFGGASHRLFITIRQMRSYSHLKVHHDSSDA